MGPTRTRTNRPQAPRGVWAQLRTLILQPGHFFRVLPGGQTWLFIALALIIVTGVSEFQRQKRLDTSSDSGGDATVQVDPGMSGGDSGGGGMGETPLPPPDAGGGSGAAGGTGDISNDLSKVLVAGGGIIVVWMINVGLLSLVTLTNGYSPKFSRNLRIAVWSTVPLGLMAVFQLVYFAAGGKAGQPGLSGLLSEWHDFTTLSPAIQSLLLSVTSRLTLFYLWAAVLLYTGARYTLRGKRIAAGFAVVAWVMLVITLPVLTGAIAVKAPEPEIPPLLELPQEVMPTEEAIAGGMMTEEGTVTAASAETEGTDMAASTSEPGMDAEAEPTEEATDSSTVDTAMATTEPNGKAADVTVSESKELRQ